ncbi:MAG: cytochrome c, partial [SAR324 cluster bacterium]|nr:cytochrome c [SAR324 cluster bacterium]
IKTGAQLFAQNCAACHSSAAIGQDPKSPMGGIIPTGGYLAPALNGTGHAWHHPNEMLFDIIKKGSSVDDSSMKDFQGKLSDEEIVMVIHYFKSLWPPEIQMRHSQR